MAYQEFDGVAASRRSPTTASLHGKTVAFDLGDYDITRPLVIDPVISYSTYVGGNGV